MFYFYVAVKDGKIQAIRDNELDNNPVTLKFTKDMSSKGWEVYCYVFIDSGCEYLGRYDRESGIFKTEHQSVFGN